MFDTLSRLPMHYVLALATCGVMCASSPPLALCQTERSPDSTAHLSIDQLGVGQGDAALITTADGKHVLIDGGPDRHVVAQFLKERRIDTLDLVIASHAHADHIGGLPEVFSSVVVRAYMDNGIPYTTATYTRTLSAVEHEDGLQYLRPTARTITLGSTTLRILPPSRADNSQNNNSVGVLVEFGRFRA